MSGGKIVTKIGLTSVPWDSQYNHVANFDSVNDRRTYFNEVTQTSTYTAQRLLNRNTGTVELSIRYNTHLSIQYNYIWITEIYEPSNSISDEWFAFITSFERVSNNTTLIRYEIDYWQTYLFSKYGNSKPVMKIKDAFILREHQDRWVGTAGSYGIEARTPIYSRTIENMEVGDKIKVDENVIHNRLYVGDTKTNLAIDYWVMTYDIGGENQQSSIYGGLKQNSIFQMIIPNIYMIEKNPDNFTGTFIDFTEIVDNSNNPLKTVDVLNVNDKKMAFSSPERIQQHNGMTTNVIGFRNIFTKTLHYINFFSLDDERILAIRKIPYLPVRPSLTVYTNSDNLVTLGLSFYDPQTNYRLRELELLQGVYTYVLDSNHVPNFSPPTLHTIEKHELPSAYRFMTKKDKNLMVYEPKLLTQEFENYVVSTMKSESMLLINENFNGDVNIKLNVDTSFHSINDLWVENYNNDDFYNRLRWENTNEMPLTTDAYKQYMRTHRTLIDTNMAINATQTTIGVGSMVAGTTLLATGRIGMGLGLLMGGLGASVNGVGGIQKELAKQNDFQNKVDKVRANVNTLGLDNNTWGDKLRVSKYNIRDEFKQKMFDLFTKQGYKANEYKVPNLESRYHFNYIHTSYVEIDTNSIGEAHVREIIQNIYNNGVTIWHCHIDLNDIKRVENSMHDYSLNNVERSLLNE